jgi:hypothetical protein
MIAHFTSTSRWRTGAAWIPMTRQRRRKKSYRRRALKNFKSRYQQIRSNPTVALGIR